MPYRTYLPSAQFSLMAGSVALSFALVWGAQAITGGNNTPSTITSVAPQNQDAQWEAQLAQIQATAPQAPAAPDQAVVAQMRESAQSSNLTQTIGKTLLINLTNAGVQGLGDDAPTQDRLVAEATTQLQAEKTLSFYTSANLTLVAQNKASLRTYGNAVLQAFLDHPDANATQTLLDMGYAVDYSSQKTLDGMSKASDAYERLTSKLVSIAVPQTLAPLHLQMVNDLMIMASSFADMQTVLTDPLRGLAGLQTFQSKNGEMSRVLTSIAQILSKNAILFNKGEAGSSWSVFVSP